MKDSKRNNAQLGIMNKSFPVVDWEIYDVKQEIWRGRILEQTEQEKNLGGGNIQIFFSRSVDKDSEYDRLLKMYEFSDELVGVPFLLVPKEKVLFVYQPASHIMIPQSAIFNTTNRPLRRRQ